MSAHTVGLAGVTAAHLDNVADWLQYDYDVENAIRELRLLAGRLRPPEKARGITAVLQRLRCGDSDGDDHDIAADVIERYEQALCAIARQHYAGSTATTIAKAALYAAQES
jgi:hypothetical protein